MKMSHHQASVSTQMRIGSLFVSKYRLFCGVLSAFAKEDVHPHTTGFFSTWNLVCSSENIIDKGYPQAANF